MVGGGDNNAKGASRFPMKVR